MASKPPPPPPPGDPAAKDPAPSPDAIAGEREYLEDLLNTRFNYYLVFASIVLLAAFGSGDIPPFTRAAILGGGSLISAPIAYSVGRTCRLLQVLLSKLDQPGSSHPYRLARKEVESSSSFYQCNANAAIELVVWLLTLMFLAAAFYVANYGMPGDGERAPAMRIEIASR